MSLRILALTLLLIPTALAAVAPEHRQALSPLPLGAVRPRGWLAVQLRQNLDQFTGQLDRLAPDLITGDDIFGRDRLSPSVKRKDLGALGVPPEEQAQFLWWNSETQGNWWDGFLRTAVLLGDAPALGRARAQVGRILGGQDGDGYLGIYARDLRYRFSSENGELWAKATCLRYLLAWYSYSGDKDVLKAVRSAVDELMRSCPRGVAHPFHSNSPSSPGVAHGIAFLDVLAELRRLTGDQRYADYAVYLYEDFSAQDLDEDGRLPRLSDAALPLKGHGVHTYEQLRCLADAAFLSGDPRLFQALSSFERKVGRCTTVSGAAIGDEYILGGAADSTLRGYEYCSLHELCQSWVELFLWSGEAGYGDRVERLFLNAAQGARHPEGRGIAYLKSDNSYAMTGPLNGDPAHPEQVRYKYSPVHRDAAVCCVPNAGRIGPAYIEHMWALDQGKLTAALLGPCEVSLSLGGRSLRVVEETDYPYEGRLGFVVEGAKEGLVLQVRKPGWCSSPIATLPFTEVSGFLRFQLPPNDGRLELRIDLSPALRTEPTPSGELSFHYGALVLAHPLEAREKVSRSYPESTLVDLEYTPVSSERLYSNPQTQVRHAEGPGSFFEARLATEGGNERWEPLVPMSRTILRQVTFAVRGQQGVASH